MFVTIYWSIAAVLGVIALMRALWEGSWVRIKWFGIAFVAVPLAIAAARLDGHVAQWPWGIGTFSSAMCWVAVKVLWGLVAFAILVAAFASKRWLGIENRNRNKTPF